jgi:LL-diaminopimelate aminotransferase
MTKCNPQFAELKREYIFPIIEEKLAILRQKVPSDSIINLGIGDVCLPLVPDVARAVSSAALEMSNPQSIRGYGPSEGYPFLRRAIKEGDYKDLPITAEEIFINDGINTDIAHALELFDKGATVAIADPTYPVYLDSAILAGKRIVTMPCLEKNRCLPALPTEPVDILFLCSPSNPTGEALTRDELKAFVDFAIANKAVILFDAAYSAFIEDKNVPISIYEIPGADTVAVEMRSFSKTAGFTGLRCGYTVVPRALMVEASVGLISLNTLWKKRQNIKSNGVSYPVQKGAESCYLPTTKKTLQEQLSIYKQSAFILKEALLNLGHTCYGGVNAPYVFWKLPPTLTSWQCFDLLLEKCHIVTIPGRGFGAHGEGFLRLSGFTTAAHAQEAAKRIATLTW